MTNPKINTNSPEEITEYDRTASSILRITEDKLKLKLEYFKESIEAKSNLFCYMSIAITLLVALLTTEFTKEVLWLQSEIWKAIFIVSLGIAILVSIKAGFTYYKKRKSVDSVIKDIKDSDF